MVGVLACLCAWAGLAAAAGWNDKLGLVSDSAKGDLRYLVIVVDFPDVRPRFSLEQIRARAIERTARWYRAASYGQTRLNGTICGPYTLPDSLESYRLSPYNFQVSSERVYRLVRDALSLAEESGVPILEYDVVAVVHRAHTMPGKAYGMICYCANPGMLSKVRGGRARYVEIKTRRGTSFPKGVVVMAENFHLGFMVHDLAHALGGVSQGKRLVMDLYDFELQSKPRRRFQIHDAAIYLGPWDIMSQHFMQPREPPAGFSLFTMIRLDYVRPDQVMVVRPGQTKLSRLAPLSLGGRTMGLKIPLDEQRYLLVENRQPFKLDRRLPASGVMIYEVDLEREDGAGLVRAKNADPSAFNFSRAPFGVDGQAADMFQAKDADLAIVPLAKLGKDYLVLVTTGGQGQAARRIAKALGMSRGTPGFTRRVKKVTRLIRQGDLRAAERAAQAR
jgi:M6 family metalloprotease-like protein